MYLFLFVPCYILYSLAWVKISEKSVISMACFCSLFMFTYYSVIFLILTSFIASKYRLISIKIYKYQKILKIKCKFCIKKYQITYYKKNINIVSQLKFNINVHSDFIKLFFAVICVFNCQKIIDIKNLPDLILNGGGLTTLKG